MSHDTKDKATTSAADFMAAAHKVVKLPSGRSVRIRKLGIDDLLDMPEAWPMLGVIIEQEATQDQKRELVKRSRDSYEVQVALIVRGVVEPEVCHKVTPIGAVRFHVEFWR